MPVLCPTLVNDKTNGGESSLHPLTVGNPAETIQTSVGPVTFYIPEFSRPTGRYVNKLLMRLLNGMVRRGSMAMAGNPCTPGLGLTPYNQPEPGTDMLRAGLHRTVVVNHPGIPADCSGIVFQAEPFMHLHIRPEWKDFRDYVNAMSSKYRVRTKKVYTESAVLSRETLAGDEIPRDLFPVMESLLARTLAKKTLALPPDLRQLLLAFSRQYGRQFEVEIYRSGGRPVGFLSRIYLGSQVHAMHIGYESEHAREWHLYQRMMYDLIDTALQRGATLVNLGRTATEIKSTLGAVAIDNSFVVYSRNPLVRLGLRTYRRWFFKTRPYVLRNPFKV